MNDFKSAWRISVVVAVLAMMAGRAPVESDDVIQFAETMLQADGGDYIVARDQILAMSPEDIDRAVEHLRRDRDDPVAELLGAALEFRARHPLVVTEVKQGMRQMIENGQLSRDGSLWYISPVPRHPSERDVLYFETLIKYDLPVRAKEAIHGVLCNANRHDHPVIVRGHLAILASNLPIGMKASSSYPLAGAAALHPDDRVLPAMMRFYPEVRMVDVGSANVVAGAFRNVSGPEALLAMEQLFAFERDLAEDQGFTPWNDPDSISLARQAAELAGEYYRATAEPQRANRPISPEAQEEYERRVRAFRPLTQAEREDYEDRIEKAQRRTEFRTIWQTLERSRKRILDRLATSQATGP